jgi:hypothetical protein
VPGKASKLFADDPDIPGLRYGAMVTSLELPALRVWRLYRGRADCGNRIKELKADCGLDSFNMAQFWATEAALVLAMLAYNLMSLFRQAAMRSEVHHTLTTLHHKVFAIGAFWNPGPEKMCCDWPWHAGDESGSRNFGLKPRATQACIDSGALKVLDCLMDNLG